MFHHRRYNARFEVFTVAWQNVTESENKMEAPRSLDASGTSRATKQHHFLYVQGGSNMTRTDLYVNKPHCAAAVRP